MTLLNVVDVEATCWDGQAQRHGWAGTLRSQRVLHPADRHHAGGSRFWRQLWSSSANYACVGTAPSPAPFSASQLCKFVLLPVLSSLSASCTSPLAKRLCHLFVKCSREACDLLRAEYHTDSRPWASWGDYDRRQIQRQAVGGVRFPFSARHTNAKRAYAEAYSLRKAGMAQAPSPTPGCHSKERTTAAPMTPGTSRPWSPGW